VNRPNLQLVDTDTGEIAGCPRCEDVQVGDLENAESENRRLIRRLKQLERDRDAERQADPRRDHILALIDRWKLKTNHPRANAYTADRFDVVKARLSEGYTVEDLELAVDGIGAFRYVVNGERTRNGTPAQRHDRLGIALGGGEAVERFANLGHRARRQS
jgi:hypothetical protein